MVPVKQSNSVQCKMATSDYCNIIYKSLNSVLEHLNNFKHLTAVKSALDVYDQVSKDESQEVAGKKYPLIVLEGLDGCGKSTATKRLSKTLDAVLFSTPPPCLSSIRSEFDKPEYTDVRAAFYSLGNYIAAMQISVMLQTRPVVLDRFWHSTAAYALAQYVCDHPGKEIPAEGDSIYKWPDDLMKPNVTAYLCVSEVQRLQRIKGRPELTSQEHLLENEQKFRLDVIHAYGRITPTVKYINGQMSKRKVEDQILEHVRPLLPN
ncbi:hypothetical protein CBL_05634 [Carabus blaptoides fortunei]